MKIHPVAGVSVHCISAPYALMIPQSIRMRVPGKWTRKWTEPSPPSLTKIEEKALGIEEMSTKIKTILNSRK